MELSALLDEAGMWLWMCNDCLYTDVGDCIVLGTFLSFLSFPSNEAPRIPVLGGTRMSMQEFGGLVLLLSMRIRLYSIPMNT